MSSDRMEFPRTPEEFCEQYSFFDKDEVYTNGSLLIPVFRVEQMVEHYFERTCHIVRASRKYVLSDGTELFDDGCSVCNGYIGDGDNYCSNCGAKVVGE